MRSGVVGAAVVICLASVVSTLGADSSESTRTKRGLLGSLLKPVLDIGRPQGPERYQQEGPQAPHLIHGAPIEDKNVVNQFLKGLYKSGQNFNVPKSRSSFFGPTIAALRQFQICVTPQSGPGKCRYVRDCVLPAFLENLDIFLSYSCVVGSRHLGVCCPDAFFSDQGRSRKPLFPILSGLLGIGDKPSPPPISPPVTDFQPPFQPEQPQGRPPFPNQGPGPFPQPDYPQGNPNGGHPHGGHPNNGYPNGPHGSPPTFPEEVHPHGGAQNNGFPPLQPVQPVQPVQPNPVIPKPVPPPVDNPPVNTPPVNPPPVIPKPPVNPPPPVQPTAPVQPPSVSAPIHFPEDEEVPEAAPPPQVQPPKPPQSPDEFADRSKPLPPIPNGLRQLITSCGLNFKTRIVGGTIAKPNDWTWMAALLRRFDDDQFCGGALISDRYVLTAAHCTQGLRPQNITVRLGEYDFKNTSSRLTRDFNVSRIRQHHEFKKDTYQNDISLLRLSRRVRFTEHIRPICLPKSRDLTFIGKLATVVGWGTLSFGGPSSSILRQVSLPVWNNTECKTKFTQAIPEIFLCAGTREGGQDACQGDSGGPLMLEADNTQWTLIGVVSWGIKCAEKGLPGVYTRITEFLPWIYENAID